MAIQHRRGNFADFDPYKMRPGEWAFPLDRGEGYYCISPGDVRRVATKEEIIEILETNQQAYDGLQQLLTELEDETVLTGILADISQLLDDVAINKSRIATNTQDIADLDTRVSTNTQDIADLDATVNTYLAENVTQGNPHGIDAKADKAQGSWEVATMFAGWTGSVQYRKNSLNIVTVSCAGLKPGTITGLTVIAILPAGYRPKTEVPITLIDPSGSVGDFNFYLSPNGNIYIARNSTLSTSDSYWGQFSFELEEA